VLFSLPVLAADPAPPAYRQVSKFDGLEDFSWLKRELNKVPAFQSQKVRYCFWTLGEGRKSVMLLAWDESGGTGKGYDTLYADRNFNGDLTEDGEKFSGAYNIDNIAEADGEKKFTLKLIATKGEIGYPSEFFATWKGGEIRTDCLPGDVKIRWSNEVVTAPIYRLGGKPVVFVSGKLHGEELGTWEAGTQADAWYTCCLLGDKTEHQLRFGYASLPGGAPQTLLRALKADGGILEEIPFTGGCACGGSYGQHLLVPLRVPPGNHLLVARSKGADFTGGPTEYLYPVTIKNDDFGKPIADPAFTELEAKFPQAKIASLRRAPNAAAREKAFPREQVFDAATADNFMMSNSLHWDAKIDNFGSEPTMNLGVKPGTNGTSRGLIKFDLSGVSPKTKIAGAQLRLTLIASPYAGAAAGARVDAYAVRREWIESNQKNYYCAWYGPKYYGNNPRPTDPNIIMWTQGGCDDPQSDRYPECAGTVAVGGFPEKAEGKPTERRRLVSFDVTEIVKKWASGEIANHGLVLKYEGNGWVDVCSSEFQDYPFRPTLEIAYEGADPANGSSVAPEENLELAREAARKTNKPLLIKFYSARCAVCKKVQATFENLTVKQALSAFEFVSLKIEDNATLAQELGVTAVPTVVLLEADGSKKKGVLEAATLLDVEKLVDALQKSK